MLAHKWFYGLMTRPDMSIKVERKLHDMRMLGRIVRVRSTQQFVWHLLTLTSININSDRRAHDMVHLNPEAIAYMQKYNHKDILLSIEKITS